MGQLTVNDLQWKLRLVVTPEIVPKRSHDDQRTKGLTIKANHFARGSAKGPSWLHRFRPVRADLFARCSAPQRCAWCRMHRRTLFRSLRLSPTAPTSQTSRPVERPAVISSSWSSQGYRRFGGSDHGRIVFQVVLRNLPPVSALDGCTDRVRESSRTCRINMRSTEICRGLMWWDER